MIPATIRRQLAATRLINWHFGFSNFTSSLVIVLNRDSLRHPFESPKLMVAFSIDMSELVNVYGALNLDFDDFGTDE
ncbi:hypothetical protein LINGRAHAP2_LOCUS26717 [Linum grandiflorum]